MSSPYDHARRLDDIEEELNRQNDDRQFDALATGAEIAELQERLRQLEARVVGAREELDFTARLVEAMSGWETPLMAPRTWERVQLALAVAREMAERDRPG